MVEYTFGILANQFRVLLTTIPYRPEVASNIILTCVVLHNFITAAKSEDNPPEPGYQLVSGDPGDKIRNASRQVKEQHDVLMNYFVNEGAEQINKYEREHNLQSEPITNPFQDKSLVAVPVSGF